MALDEEPPIDPGLPIIDAHHHLFDHASDGFAFVTKRRRFLIDDYLQFVGEKHNLIATVAVECHTMYSADGPQELRAVNETEFLNGQAAMSRTGLYGSARVAAGILGWADLRQGHEVKAVLEAYLAAAPNRFRGIRQEGMWDADPSVLGAMSAKGPHQYQDDDFQRGFAELAPLGSPSTLSCSRPSSRTPLRWPAASPTRASFSTIWGTPSGSGHMRAGSRKSSWTGVRT